MISKHNSISIFSKTYYVLALTGMGCVAIAVMATIGWSANVNKSDDTNIRLNTYTIQGKDVLIFEELLQPNYGNGAISIDVINSEIRMQSKVIDKLVARGPDVVPSIVRIMEVPGLSFDSFVRCYIVCNTVLKQSHPKERIYWNGGVKTEGDEDGEIKTKTIWKQTRFLPRGCPDTKTFRSKVINDIRQKFHLERKKGTGTKKGNEKRGQVQ